MTERDETPRPELSAFLHDQASSLDRDAAPVLPDEAATRAVLDAQEPRRRWPMVPTPRNVRTSPRSALAAAAVIALVVGVAGGFAFGRASAPKHATVAAGAASAPRDEGAPSTSVASSSFSKVSSAGSGMFAGGPALTRVFDRTTSEGIDIHAFTQDNSQFLPNTSCTPEGLCTAAGSSVAPTPTCPAENWCPPPECYSSSLQVEVANDGAAGMAGAPAFPLHDSATIASTVIVGQAEGSPANGWAVHAADPVTLIRADWSDGFSDSMKPVNGWAVVMHNGSDATATITAFDAGKAVVATLPATSNSYGQQPPECVPPPPPPPALPAPGADQPDDADAARQGITDAYQTVFTHDTDLDARRALMEDPDSVKSALDATKANFPEATNTVTVEVGEIRFLSKTEAALYFELKYSGGALFGKQIGYAKLIDGTWKISRDTMCMVASWGGGQCDPPPDPSRSSSGPTAVSGKPPATASATAN
jgi:hypothetical protein